MGHQQMVGTEGKGGSWLPVGAVHPLFFFHGCSSPGVITESVPMNVLQSLCFDCIIGVLVYCTMV